MLLRRLVFVAFFSGVPTILALSSCSSASPCERVMYGLIDRQARCSATPMAATDVSAMRARVPAACKAQSNLPGTTGLADLQAKCAFDLDKALCGGLPPNCTSFIGALSTNQPCGSDIQCKSGSCGLTKPTGLPSYCGNCQDRAPETGGCMDSSDCQPNLICQKYMDMITMMEMGVCVKAPGNVGDPCLSNDNCHGPNHCDPTGKCAPPVKKNDPCMARSDCDFGLICAGRCTTPTGLNGTCTGGDCDKDLACNPKTKLCAKVTYNAAGAMCDGVLQLCSRGTCTGGTCPTILADGAMCDPKSTTSICDTFAVCVDGTCTIPDPKKCGTPTTG